MTNPVVFIMIDGLRPDAIGMSSCPNLKALLTRSAYALNATSVMPSITLPCHTSIFHSVPPSRHGIVSNTWTPMARPLPGLIDLCKLAGRSSAMFYNWEPLRNINQPEALTLSFFKDTSYQIDGDEIVSSEAARMIPLHKPDFAFVYLGTVDTMGHLASWMSDEYFAQIARVDGCLGRVLDALPASASIVLQADHGGHERTHGTDMREDMTIPWLAAGPNIKQGVALDVPVSLLDTAPTLAHLLGIQPHAQWEGRIVREIFDA
jgi:predicted AlkP superfamily pyrophosphatase or phosphodiesterase